MKEAYILSQGSQLGGNTYCFHSPSTGENLTRHLPLIAKEVRCAALARRPHTQPQIITVEVGGNRFWLPASCCLHHVECIIQTENKEEYGVSLSSEHGAAFQRKCLLC